jgi:hypothetical protein
MKKDPFHSKYSKRAKTASPMKLSFKSRFTSKCKNGSNACEKLKEGEGLEVTKRQRKKILADDLMIALEEDDEDKEKENDNNDGKRQLMLPLPVCVPLWTCSQYDCYEYGNTCTYY